MEFPTLRGPRNIALAAIGMLAGAAIAISPANARHANPRHGVGAVSSGAPYAAIVVDANSGNVLHAASADEPRHPASLTKIMTLYLLFEQMEAGKLKLDTPLSVSEHAAAQAPSKLGLRPNDTITVEDAIRAVVTKSANDIAVVIAEAIGGSEREFAELMTRKARALGMSRTSYHNASGLPNDEQITTARDQATLGRAIQERFPRYYRYFATPSFTYHGMAMRNHNHLLGSVEGLDGIKTGYTQASGFNLVTSVRRNNRHIVSVVLGGSSAGARDARMRSLIEQYIAVASTQHSATAVAEAASTKEPGKEKIARAAESRSAKRNEPAATYEVASFGKPVPWPATPASSAPEADKAPSAALVPTTTKRPATPAASAADEPIKPIHVKTVKVRLAPSEPPTVTAVAATPAKGNIVVADAGDAPGTAAIARRPGILGVLPVRDVAAKPFEPKRDTAPVDSNVAAPITTAMAPITTQSVTGAAVPNAPSHGVVHSGWIVQVGAFDVESEARQRLNAAKAKAAQALDHADPFTEAIVKDDKTFYRARFAGLQKDQAEAACRQLKRNDIACMTIKN